MKLITNNKGFSYSPYILIVTMLLGLVMATHFVKIDNDKAIAIAQEGKITKNALEVEGVKSAARNAILFAAYQASSDVTDPYNLLSVAQTNDIQKNGPENFMKERILEYLNSVTPLASIGAYDKVDIEYKDKNGKVRTDGFIVRAEGTYLGSPVKVEKFVDSRIFYFYDKAKDIKQNLIEELKQEIKCKLGLTAQGGSFESDDNIGCNKGVLLCITYQSYNQIGDLLNPSDDLLDAGALNNKIKDAVISLVKKTANKQAFQAYGSDDIVVKFAIDHIDSNIQIVKQQQTDVCCHWACHKGRVCTDNKKEYDMEIIITGNIYVKELSVMDNSAMKVKGDGFEICSKDPIMLKDGVIKLPSYDIKEFNIPYEIHLLYSSGQCTPKTVTKASDTQQYWLSKIPSYEINKDSLQFANQVDCSWDSGYADSCQTQAMANQCGCTYYVEDSC